jgi:DNA-directed RNA polymerase beta subunit
MIDKNTGKIVDEKTTTIATIPWVTERNTCILNGSEYVTTGQQRLKPGIYSRIKESGEAEAHVNVAPGSGFGGKVIFYPDRALFVYQVGTTQIKLYGLLHDLGVPDSDMEKAWGKEIFLKNKMSYKGNEIDKFYTKVFGTYQQEEEASV